MTIYLIINKINNKQYIGQTKQSLKARFTQHCNPKIKTLIALAIHKYGKENFSIQPLAENIKTLEELNELETRYIKEFGTLSPRGYNIEAGGRSPTSEETKKKLSDALKGREVTWGNKISNGVRKLWEDIEYREKQTKQRYKKRGQYRKGIVREKSRKQIDLEAFKKDYENFLGLQSISEKYKISVHTIYKIIKREKIKKRGYKCNIKK